MKKCKYFTLTIFILLFLLNINIVIESTKYSCIIFFNKIFISIFPFIILSDILIYFDYHIFLKYIFGKILSKIFNIDPNTSIIFILSMLTSHPTNAVYIKDMLDNKQIDEITANKILCFTYFPSISFVVGVIGINIFKSLKMGLIIWLFVLINDILIGIYLRKDKISINAIQIKKEDNIFIVLKNSILKGINTSFIILGNLIIFSTIINIITKYIKINPIILSIITSTLELTNGINQISLLNTSINIKLLLTIFTLSFSSLSIIMQSATILSNNNINIKRILTIKLVFSFIITFIFLTLWNINCS